MAESTLRLAVIVGSVRGGRLGPTVADWFVGRAAAFGGFDVDVVDLAEIDLPLAAPAFGEDPPPHVRAVTEPLGARLDAADAFVVITPEYNHSFPAALKNLIDWYRGEWFAKPVGIVSYGGLSGGLRATEHLRAVFAELHAVTVRDTVSFHSAWSHWDDSGRGPKNPESCDPAAKTLLNQLTWWSRALHNAKAVAPYPA
ncbi:NAD(P)H-dependent oxidoreductase [Actinocorallia sp. A-T 12471]|uniref:NADPH-dependent FMN reductase n=1 Tax=Actinocorallia sp. A-T 12471 TaxID=3089813 RepID=UPI0029D3D889|nr:NAD(P)H-dependent oxidoreductase [Actinocorallia sp. A-T 12471]MDX6740142.1 NAD(P)H-dependent oxidoreductase [Actinocorallia sp. A-T 12471]